MRKITLLLFGAICLFETAFSQVNFTARDVVTPYNQRFRAGVNQGFYGPLWDNKTLASIAGGDAAAGQIGVGSRSIRQGLYDIVLDFYGFNLNVTDFAHYNNLNMCNGEGVAILGGPSGAHQDYAQHCPGQFSSLFANLYTPTWDGGANGTPYNDNNYWAAYVYKVVTQYKNDIRFWEIWNEPGLDLTFATSGGIGWRAPGYPGNWWENDPNPCDYVLRAPVEHYVRTLRIAYDVIKTVDPDSYVCLGSVGFQSMMDAVCRNTDNPSGGSVTPEYPFGGGAYFDCVTVHTYPHFDGSTWRSDQGFAERHSDQAADGVAIFRDSYQAVLNNYGFNGTQFPKKEWIITEANAPRQAFTGNYFAGNLAQRNFIQKAFIKAKLERIGSYHVFQLFDQKDQAAANYEFHLMGLYKNVGGIDGAPVTVGPFGQQVNDEGKAFKTVSDLIQPTTFDPVETAKMNVPAGAKGYAFRRDNGTFVYALWAVTTEDLSEQAFANYSFPAAMGLTNLVRYNWDWGYSNATTTVGSTNINLDATPVFFTKSGSNPNPCSVNATVSNILCNNNGTASNPADDTYTFQVTVTGANTGMGGWTTIGGVTNVSGQYGVAATFGPYPISGGGKSFFVKDATIVDCAKQVDVQAPSTCSGTTPPPTGCAGNLLTNSGFETGNFSSWDASGAVTVGAGGNAGSANAATICANQIRLYQTKSATAGSAYTFKTFARTNGSSASGTLAIKFMNSSWTPLQQDFAPVAATAAFSEFSIQKTAPAGTAWVEISIIKESGTGCLVVDDACLTTGGSTTACSISASVSNIVCSNNGTPTVSSDDTFTFSVTVNSTGSCGAGWSASGGATGTGSYGTAKSFGPFPISGGGKTLTITDASNPTATTSVTAAAPATCSNTTNPTVSFTFCPQNQTVTAAASSTSAIVNYQTPTATATNCSASPTVTLTSGLASGAAFPIGTTNVVWTATCGGATATCAFSVTVNASQPPSGCANNLLTNNGFSSGLTDWEGGAATVVAGGVTGQAASICTNQTRIYQTKNATAGSTYTFKVFAKNNGQAATGTLAIKFLNSSWTPLAQEFQPIGSTSGSFAEFTATKLAPAGTARVEVSIIKETGAGCLVVDDACLTTGGTTTGCTLTATVSNISCDNAGTPTNPADDNFFFTLLVSGSGQCGTTWSNGGLIQGTIGTPKTVGPTPISNFPNGQMPLNLFASSSPTSTVSLSVPVPATCSGGSGSLDLRLANFSFLSTGVPVGGTANFTADIQNFGPSAVVGSYELAGFLSSDNVLSANDPKIYSRTFSNTPVGPVQLAIEPYTVPANTATGQYFLILKVDNGSAITETDENNNVLATSSPVTVTTPSGNKPDLELTLTTPNLNPGQWANAPLTLTIKNNGTVAANGVKVQFLDQSNPNISSKIAYVSSTAAAGTIFNNWTGLWDVIQLQPGESKILTYNGFTRVATGIAVFGQVSAQSPADLDSSPANNTTGTPAEDDEARINLNGTPLLAGDDRDSETGEIVLKNDFEVFPNPASNAVALRLTDYVGKGVTIRIFDQFGRERQSLKIEKVERPFYEFELDETISSGQHFVHLTSDGLRPMGKKLLVQRDF